ncbi:MAG: hypothetical protein GXO71_04040 [Caldiserica bacterium]|nr:hypothetical protein [Caldisericota bacterium]
MKGKIIVLAIVILLAVGFIVKQAIPKKYTYEAVLLDTEAKVLYKAKIPLGVKFPIKSPYSGKKTAYPAYQCAKDGTIFPYVPPPPPKEGEEVSPDYGIPKCPKDGSLDVDVPILPEGKTFIKLK